MKHVILSCFMILSIISCQTQQQEVTKNTTSDLTEIIDTIPEENTEQENTIEASIYENFDLDQHLKNYNILKSNIKKHKQRIRNTPTDSIPYLEVAGTYFSNILIDSVFQYWVGTEWDFNGYTATPRKGLIACGYFVSTTLKHIGVPINRYKVAQKAASDIVKDLCHRPSTETFDTLSKLENYMTTQADNEIFVLGLSNHVGFVFKRNGQSYFAHSNYMDNAGVMIEPFEKSEALKMSFIYVIGNVSKNKSLIKGWLKN